MTATRKFSGILSAPDGAEREISASIHEPVRSGEGDWSCLVECPFLFPEPKRIAGADAAQAVQLAESFLEMLLQPHGVVLRETTGR